MPIFPEAQENHGPGVAPSSWTTKQDRRYRVVPARYSAGIFHHGPFAPTDPPTTAEALRPASSYHLRRVTTFLRREERKHCTVLRESRGSSGRWAGIPFEYRSKPPSNC